MIPLSFKQYKSGLPKECKGVERISLLVLDFQTLKPTMVSLLVLDFLDFSKPFELECDTSGCGIGVVL